MTTNGEPLHRDIAIVNELGMHARSAAKVAKLAQNASGKVWLEMDAERVDAKEVIDLLTLAAGQGDRLRIVIEAPEDIETLNRMADLFASGFGE